MADPRFSPAELSRPVQAPLADDPFYERDVEGIDLRELFDILVRGRWIILASVLLLAIPVGIWSMVSPSQYQSSTTLLINKSNTSLTDVMPTQMQLYGNDQKLGNEILVLRQSLPLAQAVAARLVQMERAPGSDAPLTILEAKESGDSLTVLDVAFRLQSYYVSASIYPDADAITVSAVSTDPAEAAVIANLYSEEFEEVTRDVSRASYSEAREFLESQVGTTEQELMEADDRVQEFMLREGAVALDEESGLIVNRIAEAQAQRDAAEIQARTLQARLTALQAELDRLEPNLRRSYTSGAVEEVATARERLREVEGQLAVFYQRNPALRDDPVPGAEVQRLREEAQRLERRIDTLLEQVANQSLAAGSGPGDNASGFTRAGTIRAEIADTRVALSQAQAEQKQLTSRIGAYERDLRSIPAQSIELAQLQRDRIAAEQLYTALRTNLQEAQVAEQSQIGHARMIRPAFPAELPFGPKRLRNVALAMLLGLMAGAALAVAKVRLDHRVHRPDDVRNLGVTLLGTIPDTTELIATDFGGSDVTNVDGRDIDSHLVTLLNPMAAASESYRALRTSVQFSRPDTVIQSLLVTSANPSEGKSTVALNLAAVMAQSGRRVLVIDADLRKPSVHKKAGLSREPGLVQALFGEGGGSTLELGAHEIGDDLHVLTAGPTVPNPSELLGSRRMRDFLDSVKGQFDVVVIDAPPVLAATDAVLLSTQVDATVVIARAGATKDFELESTFDTLRAVGAKTIGVVLNGFDVNQAYGYKYKYAYQYSSDYAYGSEKA